VFAAGKHGGEISRFDARRPVPDAVDAAMYREKRSALDAQLNDLRRQPGIEELPPGDDSMLRLGDSSDYALGRPGL